jgi:hypothetical protein
VINYVSVICYTNLFNSKYFSYSVFLLIGNWKYFISLFSVGQTCNDVDGDLSSRQEMSRVSNIYQP